MSDYGEGYYEHNEQAGDRPALAFYHRLFTKQMHGASRKKRILEYGCGVGHLTKRLANDFQCYALDISDYALSQVNKNAPKATTLKTITPIEDNSLDGIIGLHVLEHIKYPEKTLQDFLQKLKPGGLLMYVVPNPDGYGHWLKRDKWFGFSDKTHISMFSEKHWVELTTRAGFEILKVRGDGMWDVPYIPLLPAVLQKLIFFPPAAIQFWTGSLFLPTKLGECLVVIARKKAT